MVLGGLKLRSGRRGAKIFNISVDVKEGKNRGKGGIWEDNGRLTSCYVC